MKCGKLLCVCVFALFSVCSLTAQASQLSMIPEILNGLDTSTNNLEKNMTASNLIIQDLSLKVNSMQTTIEMQQRQLRRESENSANWERIAQERSQEYEQTLQSLETSLITSLKESAEKDGKILELTQTNAKQAVAIFIMGGIIGLVIVCFIVKLVIKIKTGGISEMLKFLK
jgi:anionic cell wall polymer biosynthesis LytR-Cps2A-Psr (LCP) family protein